MHPNRSTEPSESPVSPVSATPFCTAELQRALTEQTFAIEFTMIPPTQPEEARASIMLPDGDGLGIDVKLTMQGFTIVEHPSSESGTVYETLEDLLHGVSPEYRKKHQEAILEALSKLS